eukprot:813991-Prymnesium_polylepis.1
MVDMVIEGDEDTGSGGLLQPGETIADSLVKNDLTAELDLTALVKMLPTNKYAPEHKERCNSLRAPPRSSLADPRLVPGRQMRSKLWNEWDASGNGFISLLEVDTGFRNMLGAKGKKTTDALAPALARAFYASRDAKTEGKAAEYVTRGEEFRLLLVYLKRYIELLVAFDRVDTSDDRKINKEEFRRAVPLLCTWGVNFDISYIDEEFDRVDKDGSGSLLFDEFSIWAVEQGLDMDPSDNAEDEETLRWHHKSTQQVAAQGVRETKTRMREMEQQAEKRKSMGRGDLTQKVDLTPILAKLPTDKNQGKEIAKLFESFDANHNGFLTLVEVQQGLQTALGSSVAIEGFAPAVMRAFHAARDYKTTGKAADFVTKA